MPTELVRIIKMHLIEMFSKAQIRQTFVYTSPNHNGLKKKDMQKGHTSPP
jgi:hypothetical protein